MISPRHSERRVVITGLGVVSPIGNDVETMWQSLVEGRSGVSILSSTNGDGASPACAGEAKAFRGEIDDFGPLEAGL